MRCSSRSSVVAISALSMLVVSAIGPALAVGSDPGLPQQWSLRQIGAATSWGRGVVGTGATVAVLDTGIDAGHEDLRDQVAAAVSCVGTSGDARRCRAADGGDIQGHGTHVSGSAAAASNNVGVAGVAPGARIVSVRVFQEDVDPVTGEKDYFATSSDINAGIRWVLANVATKGSINLSLGGNFAVTTIDGAGFEVGIEEAWRAGWVPVLASGNENVLGVAGVAPGARIVSVRVFQEDVDPVSGEKDYYATSSDINAGIRWVLANVATKGSINLSLGGNFAVTTIDGAGFEVGIEEAWRAGWVPVLASGNENLLGVAGSSNYGSLNSLVIGATGPDDELARYSSPFGNAKWGLVAPGGNARSCDSEPARCVLSTFSGGQYGLLQGTSMATPHAAGAAALLLGAGLTNAQTVQRLLETANKRVACGDGCKGRLDVAAATAGLGAPSAGGGGASDPPTTASPAPAAAGPASAPSGTVGSAPTRRPPAPRGSAAPAPASTEPPVETAQDPTAPPVSTEEPPIEDGLTGLSIESADDAVEGSEADDGDPPLGWSLAALAALAGASATALLAWRRRGRASP